MFSYNFTCFFFFLFRSSHYYVQLVITAVEKRQAFPLAHKNFVRIEQIKIKKKTLNVLREFQAIIFDRIYLIQTQYEQNNDTVSFPFSIRFSPIFYENDPHVMWNRSKSNTISEMALRSSISNEFPGGKVAIKTTVLRR